MKKVISLAPNIEAWRVEAIRKVEAHFNQLAIHSLHDDLAQLALGLPCAVAKRELHRQELFALIADAKSPAEIKAVAATLS